MKFDLNLLNSFFNENGVELVGEYDKINRQSIIHGKCKTENCIGEFRKAFRTLFDNNSFYCDECMNQIKKSKIKETNIQNCGFSSNLLCPLTKEKIKQTNLLKYGCEFHLHNEEIKLKRNETFIKKYGSHPLKNMKIKQKIKNSNLENHGVENVFQSNKIKEKIKNTTLQKYGVKNVMLLDEIKYKVKKTNLIKYGNECSLHSEVIKMKMKENNYIKYGTEYPAQNSEIAEKMSKSSYSKKEYIMPSGKIINIQGFEKFALDYLILKEQIKEDDILTGCKNVPTIWYNDENNKKHRHYVDIFIPNLNKCIEVKSTWTAEKKKDCIFLKQNAAKELGYNYEIWVYDGKGNRVKQYL
jgi:ribosomal protein S26